MNKKFLTRYVSIIVFVAVVFYFGGYYKATVKAQHKCQDGIAEIFGR